MVRESPSGCRTLAIHEEEQSVIAIGEFRIELSLSYSFSKTTYRTSAFFNREVLTTASMCHETSFNIAVG